MNYEQYLAYFDDILQSRNVSSPYDKAAYLDYTKLNAARMSRWTKTGVIQPQVKDIIKSVAVPQHWVIITEPWCGDAAHVIPFIILMADENPLITVTLELRDAPPHRINQYLTKGGKSIPKLVVFDGEGKELFSWGPRPAECQLLYETLQKNNADFETIKESLQKWYNEHKGVEVQTEIAALVEGLK